MRNRRLGRRRNRRRGRRARGHGGWRRSSRRDQLASSPSPPSGHRPVVDRSHRCSPLSLAGSRFDLRSRRGPPPAAPPAHDFRELCSAQGESPSLALRAAWSTLPPVHPPDVDPCHVDEFTLRFDRGHVSLEEPADTPGPPSVRRGDPGLEPTGLADERRLAVADGEAHGRTRSVGDHVGRGQHHVEGAGQHGPVYAAGRPFVGRERRSPVRRRSGARTRSRSEGRPDCTSR